MQVMYQGVQMSPQNKGQIIHFCAQNRRPKQKIVPLQTKQNKLKECPCSMFQEAH